MCGDFGKLLSLLIKLVAHRDIDCCTGDRNYAAQGIAYRSKSEIRVIGIAARRLTANILNINFFTGQHLLMNMLANYRIRHYFTRQLTAKLPGAALSEASILGIDSQHSHVRIVKYDTDGGIVNDCFQNCPL